MLDKKVSVIIPVYNAEKYLGVCIESLLAQTLKECEFIFVNDGSKDRSEQIIHQYKEKDKRIILISQDNQGVSSARNKGLETAVGEYIGFVDADDSVKKDMFETLYVCAKKGEYDVVISDFESEWDGNRFVSNYPFPKGSELKKTYIEEEIIPFLLKSDSFNSIWNKLFRKEIIVNNCLKFPTKMSLGEDGYFNMIFFIRTTKAYYVDYSGYYYKDVPGSATRNLMRKDYFLRALETYSQNLPEIKAAIKDESEILKLKSIKLINILISLIHLYFNPEENISFKSSYFYVKTMIRNKNVKKALPFYYEEYKERLGNYEKLLILFVKMELTMGLYIFTAYSRFRNR